MRRTLLHEITTDDVGRTRIMLPGCPTCGRRRTIELVGVMGRVMAMDVGKRLYDVGGVVQVESSAQRDARQGAKP